MTSALDGLFSFTLTYLVHSTVLILLVASIVRFLAPRSNPVREALWTIALFGGIFTAAVQVAGLDSASATWRFAAKTDPDTGETTDGAASETSQHVTASAPIRPEESVQRPIPPLASGNAFELDRPVIARPRDREASGESLRRSRVGIGPQVTERELPRLHTVERSTAVATESKTSWSAEVVAVLERAVVASGRFAKESAERMRGIVGSTLALTALLGIAYLGLLVARSRRALAARRLVEDGPLFARLAELRRRLSVREEIALSISDTIATPVAFGLLRFEICVPRRSLDLDPEQQDAMLAHEIAHLVRRDPCRLLLSRAVESVAFFQPLNRLARRRLFEVVEMRCDAFAVERLGDGLALAGCLAEVASWLHDRGGSSLAPAMAETKSMLSTRIETLLDTEGVIAREHRRRWLAPIVFGLLPGVAFVAPGVAIGAPLDFVGGVATESLGLEERDAVADDGDSDTVDEALSEVLSTLDREIAGLNSEIASLRVVLGVYGRSEFDDSLATLEARLERLDQKRRAVDSVWRRMRDAADRADDAPTFTALPESRRKP